MTEHRQNLVNEVTEARQAYIHAIAALRRGIVGKAKISALSELSHLSVQDDLTLKAQLSGPIGSMIQACVVAVHFWKDARDNSLSDADCPLFAEEWRGMIEQVATLDGVYTAARRTLDEHDEDVPRRAKEDRHGRALRGRRLRENV